MIMLATFDTNESAVIQCWLYKHSCLYISAECAFSNDQFTSIINSACLFTGLPYSLAATENETNLSIL